MAASSGVHSYGSTLGYADTSGGSYTSVGEVIDIDHSWNPAKATKFTHLNSDNAANEYKPGLAEPGTMKATVNYTKTAYNACYGLYRSLKYWKITSPDSGNMIIYGFITDMSNPHPDDDRVTFTVTIQGSGKPTYATS